GEGLRCHNGGHASRGPGPDPARAHDLASELVRLLSSNGHRRPVRLVEDEAVDAWLGAADVLVLRPPVLDKDTVRRRAGGALLPSQATRFRLPYRVLGLAIPLATLGGPRDTLVAELERRRARPLACLGAGLTVDRRYLERLWQFADHRIPDRLFADEAGRQAYAEALARAAVP